MFSSIRKNATNFLYPLAKRVVRKKEGMWHHRKMAFHILEGVGVEFGALGNPQLLSKNATVEYVDLISKEEAILKYPGVSKENLVDVTHICDIDKDGFKGIEDNSKDFVVLCHVIEHTANPIFIFQEIFRILKPNGYFAIACPDKDYTFDKMRPLTTWEHLYDDWINKINYVEDTHLSENVKYLMPQIDPNNKIEFQKAIELYKNGMAHVHVWNSETIKLHLENALKMFSINYKIIFECKGNENEFEYFAILKKG